MLLKIDRDAVKQAIFLTSATEYSDERRYYQLGLALIVTRNGFDLLNLVNRVVDAQVGWDIALPGFTADETQIGQRRPKVTLHRPLRQRGFDNTLSGVLKPETGANALSTSALPEELERDQPGYSPAGQLAVQVVWRG